MEHLSLANQHFVNESFEEAASVYSKAIGKLMGKDQFPALFGRAKCRIEKGNIDLAISDLIECVSLDPKHELSNYYLGYYLMKQNPSNYDTLVQCKKYFEIANQQESNNKERQSRFQSALNKVKTKLETLSKPNVENSNNVSDKTSDNTEEKQAESVDTSNGTNNSLSTDGTKTANNNGNVSNVPKIEAIRDTWYQSPTTVTYTLYIKNLTKNDVSMKFDTNSISYELKLPNGKVYNRTMTLFGTIVPDKCRFTVNKYKISCVLTKGNNNEWRELEALKSESDSNNKNKNNNKNKSGISAPWTTKKDWNKVDSYASEELEKDKPEGDEALQSLFQKIYKDADEDQRRAMVKSFQTSGGTVLSTNWGDVKNKDYEGKDKVLPTGQDVRKWEY